MSNSGSGGAESRARSRQYDCGANSSLVLAADDRSNSHEPSGEPESLSGKIDPRSFGDLARPEKLDQGMGKKKRLEVESGSRKRRKLGFHGGGVLDAVEEGVYRPRTGETRAAYEAVLGLIAERLGGGMRPDVVFDAADGVLGVLKDGGIVGSDEKRKAVEELLGVVVPDNLFDQLVSLARLITDFRDFVSDAGDVDHDMTVAVEVGDDEDDEDEDSDVDVDVDVVEDDGDSSNAMWIDGGGYGGTEEEADEGVAVSVHEIDAYWLQRKISQHSGSVKMEPEECHKLAEEVLVILAGEDERVVEERLLLSLGTERFGLVKYLLKNRMQIVWLTRLARAENVDQKEKIEEEMMSLNSELAGIVEQLHGKKVTAKERQDSLEKSIRKGASHLRCGGGGNLDTKGLECGDRECGWSKGARQLIDLHAKPSSEEVFSTDLLPSGCCRIRHKEYEEFHVPALKTKPPSSGEVLVQISAMPHWAQPAFEGMIQLNRIQSKVYETALFTAENILLCAPTGAGKTNVAMLTILQQIALHRNPDGSFNNSKYKIVYVAPMKALVGEVVRNLSSRLGYYNVRVEELSGDLTLTRHQIEATQVLVTTPEKWDIITRKAGDRTYTELVKLIIIDEIHLLHDSRGPVLESIVARTVRLTETTKEHIRLVGLSATLPNYEDVASFLLVDVERGLFRFDNSYRPCPLSQQYIGITVKKPLQRVQLMNDLCYKKVVSVAGRHQVLIFVHSRKDTANTAYSIRDTAIANDTVGMFLKEGGSSHEMLCTHIELVKNNDLKNLLPYGFAIHHAGMARSDRLLVEKLFAEGHVSLLISTATLAWGVNLPAHTVIIKGTDVYNPEKGTWTELSPLDIMQMLGRAGRPQYDSYGEGIILTAYSQVRKYLSLMNEQFHIESQFASRLADQLNAEIVLGTVQDAKEACNWIQYTYLYVRMLKNPTLYGIAPHVLTEDNTLTERRADLIHTAATTLDRINLVKYDQKSGLFQGTDLGRIASYYYITHGTISTYNTHLKPTMGDIEICQLFCLSEEFKYVTVRQYEKMELAKLLSCVPIPIKESLEDPSSKVNVLLQAYISKLKLEGLSLASDMMFITQNAGRLLRALFEIVLKRGWARVAERVLNLCKMVNKRMWSVQTPLKQFPGIPYDILMKLEKKNLAWERYYDLSPQEIGELIHVPKMGRTLHRLIHQIPRVKLAARVWPITRTILKFELTITPDFQWDGKVHGVAEPFWVIVEDNNGEYILHHEYFILNKEYIDEDHTLNFTVAISEPLPPEYFIHIISDRWLGSHSVLPVSFRHLILPEKYPPPTELLDLQPLPVTALRNPSYEAFYQDFKLFNPVQTQVFSILFNTDENVLVAAPTGNGKTACAEFALLRNHQKGPENTMCAVYIAPMEALALERYCDWERKFGRGLGLQVFKLTGEVSYDLKLLEKGQIIISTPEKWDALSLRWKQRKHVQQVSLFIVDELHLIGGQSGAVLEVIICRMRYLASQSQNKIRIVALSTSLANAKDIGAWIGSTSHGIFNFCPAAHFVPLETHLQAVDVADFGGRMQIMTKQAYKGVAQHCEDRKPAIVFVPAGKCVQLTAVDFMMYSNVGGGAKSKFCLKSLGELEPSIDKIKEPILRATLSHGIGYLHETLTGEDQEVVLQLFRDGWIQICVMSSSMCWKMPLSAKLVVIMGTQYYDKHLHKNTPTDYPLTDMLQMMGRAGRPLLDSSGKCVVLCHAPHKEYFKKFLYEPLPIESHLQYFLHEHLNAEVAAGVIKSKQDAVDYLTWTFMYRRLTENPNYYNLHGVSHRHLSDHLSELVENTLNALEASKCLIIEDDNNISPSNLGRIAAYYHVSCTTIERFSALASSKTKMKALLEILTSASEYAELPVRSGDEKLIRRLRNHQRFSSGNITCIDSHVKANVLLQSHFSRQLVGDELASDQRLVLILTNRLLQAMVDVMSNYEGLGHTLLAMEVSQMVTQGMWERDSVLLQLPHLTNDVVKKLQANSQKSIESIFYLMEMGDEKRRELLEMSDTQLLDIATFCKHYPNIDIMYEVMNSDKVIAGEVVTLQVILERDLEDGIEVGSVYGPRFPEDKEEGWWLVVGDTESDKLLAIKRVFLQRNLKVKLEFTANAEAGMRLYTLYLMCDSYLGCDQEYSFTMDVKEAEALKDIGCCRE